MAKVTPLLWKHDSNRNGEFPIYLRIADARQTLYLSTGVYIRRSHWNDRKQRVRQSHRNAATINELISERLIEAEREMIQRKTRRESITAKELKTILGSQPSAVDFFAFADGVVLEMERQDRIHSQKRYKSIVGRFRRFAGEPLPFDKITPKLLADFETHLMEKHGNSTNTIAGNFRGIRAIYYRAIREGSAGQENNPFFHFKIKHAKTHKHRLTADDIDSMESLALESETLIWHVRNYFLFSYYCAGIRFSDLATLRQANLGAGRLSYEMRKTGRRHSVPLLPPAQKIVDHYTHQGDGDSFLFPLLDGYDLSTERKLINAIGSQNALVNKYLKKIRVLAGIEYNFSFHVARHSFADIARKREWSVYDISKALGHSSITVTENYLAGFDEEALDTKMAELFGDQNILDGRHDSGK